MIPREKLAAAFLDAANQDDRHCFVWCDGYNDDENCPYDFEMALIDGTLNLLAGVDAILKLIENDASDRGAVMSLEALANLIVRHPSEVEIDGPYYDGLLFRYAVVIPRNLFADAVASGVLIDAAVADHSTMLSTVIPIFADRPLGEFVARAAFLKKHEITPEEFQTEHWQTLFRIEYPGAA